MPELSFAPLLDLVTLLRAADIEASTDPAELSLPGVWVTLDNFDTTTHAGGRTIVAACYLIVGDAGYADALAALAELYNRVTTAGVGPDGPVVAQGVQLQGGATPLPALRMPVNLYT